MDRSGGRDIRASDGTLPGESITYADGENESAMQVDLFTVRELAAAEAGTWREGDCCLAGGTWPFPRPQPHIRRLRDLTSLGWPATRLRSGDGSGEDLKIAATCTVVSGAGRNPRTEMYFVDAVDAVDAVGPAGAKSMSESPFNPAAPALANVLRDATGIRFRELPLTGDRIWAALAARCRLDAAPDDSPMAPDQNPTGAPERGAMDAAGTA